MSFDDYISCLLVPSMFMLLAEVIWICNLTNFYCFMRIGIKTLLLVQIFMFIIHCGSLMLLCGAYSVVVSWYYLYIWTVCLVHVSVLCHMLLCMLLSRKGPLLTFSCKACIIWLLFSVVDILWLVLGPKLWLTWNCANCVSLSQASLLSIRIKI